MASNQSSASSETLIISEDSDNEAIRFGSKGGGTASLQLAVELFRSGGEVPSDVDEAVVVYIDRIKHLQQVKHLIVNSLLESTITTFLSQAIHYLSAPSPSSTDTTKLSIFPNVESLTITSGVFDSHRLLADLPLFVILSNSLPHIHKFVVKCDGHNLKEGRSPAHDAAEYLRLSKKRSWKKMKIVENIGVFFDDNLPALPGGKTIIKFLPPMRTWPRQAGRSTMSGIDLGPMTNRLARALGIRNVVKETLHVSGGGKCVLPHTISRGKGEKEESEAGEVIVHGEVVLKDFDTGLDLTGCHSAEGEWIEAKVRAQVKDDYGKYGKVVEEEAQRRVSFRPCAAAI